MTTTEIIQSQQLWAKWLHYDVFNCELVKREIESEITSLARFLREMKLLGRLNNAFEDNFTKNRIEWLKNRIVKLEESTQNVERSYEKLSDFCKKNSHERISA